MLQNLHGQILADDPGLALDRLTAVVAAPAHAAVFQLPAPVADFTGRVAELSELSSHLAGNGMAVTVISDMPGAGKTALAVRAAHMARRCFPGGQLCALP